MVHYPPVSRLMDEQPQLTRRLCAHADDGQPMHWLEPGEKCDRVNALEPRIDEDGAQ